MTISELGIWSAETTLTLVSYLERSTSSTDSERPPPAKGIHQACVPQTSCTSLNPLNHERPLLIHFPYPGDFTKRSTMCLIINASIRILTVINQSGWGYVDPESRYSQYLSSFRPIYMNRKLILESFWGGWLMIRILDQSIKSIRFTHFSRSPSQEHCGDKASRFEYAPLYTDADTQGSKDWSL